MRILFVAIIFGVMGLQAGEQLILSIAPTWNSTRGQVQCFEKTNGHWRAMGLAVPVLYGKNGLAWGRGIYGQEESGLRKVEGDNRAPAGVFKLGKIYTYDSVLPIGADYPFFTVTKNCAWPDDSANPYYNRHITVNPAARPEWFEKQKMRHGDVAFRWLIEIRHNSDPPVAGEGSAIFFHTRRGIDRPSAGCTVMASEDLIALMCWLRAAELPRYCLLPRSLYELYWRKWNLPPPAVATALLKE